MNFTNWINWFLFFFKKEDVSEIDSNEVHGREEEVSLETETLNSHTTDSVKFKALLEKIHKYDILGESEYEYIINLPREKVEYINTFFE